MIAMPELSANLWTAWRTIDDWWKKYWGVDLALNNVSWGEWTAGAITPFIVTALAPSLGCRPVRLEKTGEKQKRIRADYVLFKDQEELVYIEHESYSRDVYGEMTKLIAAKVPLKVVVTYDQESVLEDLAKDIFRRVEERSDSSDWLLIGGITDSSENMVDLSKWVAYSIPNLKGKTTITRL